MTAKELIEAISQSTGYPKANVKAVLEAEAKVLGDQLQQAGDAVSILGSYKVVQFPGTDGENKLGGGANFTPARSAIRFKPAKDLAARIARI